MLNFRKGEIIDLLLHTDLVDNFDPEGYREISYDLTELLSGRRHSIPNDIILEVLPRLYISACTVVYHEFVDRLSFGYELYVGGSKADHSSVMSENFIKYSHCIECLRNNVHVCVYIFSCEDGLLVSDRSHGGACDTFLFPTPY